MRTYIAMLSLLAAGGITAETAPPGTLGDASLEELMNIEISSFSRKQQKLRHTAGAVFVITADDIRRSGATVLPEVLRLAPGLHVARIDSTKWAISARGFANRLSNKMLVLIDGRSIYNNVYGGVFWDQHDLPLEEVERIEVIRGPGATSWGANAMNGVINIITRRAGDTQGMRLGLVSGNEERGAASARWGGQLGRKLQYRLTGKAFELDGLRPYPGGRTPNGWSSGRAGFRMDWQPTERDEVSVQGDLHRLSAQQTIGRLAQTQLNNDWAVAGLDARGGFAMARWQHRGDRVETALQVYSTNEWRGETLAEVTVQQTDVDLQQRYRWRGAHDLVWGGGFRDSRNRVVAGRVSFTPDQVRDTLTSLFVQDEFVLVPDRWMVTVGTRLLHSFTGPELQPGVRLLWTPGQRTSWWASATRAVRMPSHYDRGVNVPFGDPVLPLRGRLLGSASVQPESVRAFESGVRRQVAKRLLLDTALFASDYQDLLSAPVSNGRLQGGFVYLDAIYVNERRTRSYGAETVLQWEINSRWRASGNHSWYLGRHELPPAATRAPVWGEPGGRDPAHTSQGRLSGDLTRRMSFDLFVYRQSRMPIFAIPAAVRVDARYSWRWRPDLEISGGVRNALQSAHVEHVAEDLVKSAVRRTAYIRLDWTLNADGGPR